MLPLWSPVREFLVHQGALDGFSGHSGAARPHNGGVNELEPPRPSRSTASQGLGFNLFGFPTRVDASFLLIVGLIGFDGSGSHLAIWVAVAVISVLGHELGHALAARLMGATASITLAGLGGLTRSSRAEPLGRGESAVLTAAGPLAGILLGLPVLYAVRTLGWPSWTDGGYALRSAAFTTLGWSALNLLPMLPLDGGHLLELALPGTPAARRRLAAQLSIGIAAAAGYLAVKAGMQYGMFLALMFGAQNLAILRSTPALPAQPTPPGPAPAQPGPATQPGPAPGPPPRRSLGAILLEPVPPRRKPEGGPPVASPPAGRTSLPASPPVMPASPPVMPVSPPVMPASPPIVPESGPPTGTA
ncbi:MAG: stage sporulation protein [Actinomycetota bacterium]|nr:stage sporulation protein [Actinomycetota bacterium]